jgi:hypothetical protein
MTQGIGLRALGFRGKGFRLMVYNSFAPTHALMPTSRQHYTPSPNTLNSEPSTLNHLISNPKPYTLHINLEPNSFTYTINHEPQTLNL